MNRQTIKSFQSTRGFSLVELSIVLVILGLLTGGILAGQSLIRASELRAMSTDVQKVQAMVNTFRDKYFELPGDFSNATKFWTSLGGTGSDATCQDLAATTTATCNGNGDGSIGTSVVANDERVRAWQHLANAGLIEGSYTGKTDGASGTLVLTPGLNAPRWKGNTTGDLNTTIAGSTGFRMDGAKAGLILAHRGGTSGVQPLSPEETWNIDTKMDDGKPGYGIVIGAKSTWAASTGCTTTDLSATAEYSLTNPAKICRFDFQIY